MYTKEEAEGKRLRNPFDTITEGVGINRVTKNFEQAIVDDAFKVSDRESVEMAAFLLRQEGLFVGSSAAVNCVGAVKAARILGPGHTIVTMLCDGGQRHLSKFHSHQYLQELHLQPEYTGDDVLEFVM
jgi:cysteine synthase A